MNITQKGFEEFDILTDHAVPQIVFEGKESFHKQIKSHFKQMFLSLANERIESLRGIKQKMLKKARLTDYADRTEYDECAEMVEQELTYYEGLIKDLSKIE